jgi:hypothetical protein
MKNREAESERSRLRSSLLSVVIGAALAIGLVTSLAKICFADENGISFWLPGLFGSLAAVPQQPGWSLTVINYYDSVSASGNVAAAREISIGRLNTTVNVNLNVNVSANLDLILVNPNYVFATPVLGGQLAVGMMGVAGRNGTELNGTISAGVDGLTATRQGSISDTVTGVGDVSASDVALEQRRQQLDDLRDGRHPGRPLQFEQPSQSRHRARRRRRRRRLHKL